MEPSRQVDVVDAPDKGYYELRVDGQVAGGLVYQPVGSRRVFLSVAVDPQYRGLGLTRRLMSGALDDVRARRETFSSQCPILDRFLADNPEYDDLRDPAHPVRPRRLR